MKHVRRWQEQYLSDDADDSEYNRIEESLEVCPDCAKYGGLGWVVVPVAGSDGEPEPQQELCARCFATGYVL